MIQTAVILSIGDELTLGQIADTNSAWLSARLIEQGVLTRYHKTVPDDQPAIVAALHEAARSGDLVLVTGGLGPTQDDLTRQALAQAARTPLRTDPTCLRELEAFFRRIRRPMADQNRVQAMAPRGAALLANPCGTAPGIRLRLHGTPVIAMPGVPHEMTAMFALHIRPILTVRRSRVILTRALRTFGLGESSVAECLAELMNRTRNPRVGTTVSGGIVTVRIRSESDRRPTALRKLQETIRQVRRRLGSAVYGEDDATLADAIAPLLLRQGRTLVVAEDFTFGRIAGMLGEAAATRPWFLGASVAPVPPRNRPMPASAMARRALRLAKASCALAATASLPGRAPAATNIHPIQIAVALRHGSRVTVHETCFRWRNDPARIRDVAARMALNFLRITLLNIPPTPP